MTNLSLRRRSVAGVSVAALAVGLAVSVSTGMAALPAHAAAGVCPQTTTNVTVVPAGASNVTNRVMNPIAGSTMSLAAPTAAAAIPQVDKFDRVLGTTSADWLVGVQASGSAVTTGSTTDTTGGLWIWRRTNGAWGQPGKFADSVDFRTWVGSSRQMITLDANNNVWTIDSTGALRLTQVNFTTRTITSKLKLMGTDYAGTNLLVATGTGVLWSRTGTTSTTTNGDVFRTQFDLTSQRLISPRKRIGWGFERYATIISPGYDVMYGVMTTGVVETWKFNEGTGWDLQKIVVGGSAVSYRHVWVPTNSCAAPASFTPADLNLSRTLTDAPAVAQWANGPQPGQVDIFHVDRLGQFILTSNTDRTLAQSTWTRSILANANYVDGPSAAFLPTAPNTTVDVEYVFTHAGNGHVVLWYRTSSDTTWVSTDLQGRFSGAPAAVRRSDNSAAVVITHSDGSLWGRWRPYNSGDFVPWAQLRPATGNPPALVGNVSAAPATGGRVTIAGRTADGTIQIGTWDPAARTITWSARPGVLTTDTPNIGTSGSDLRLIVRSTETGNPIKMIGQSATGDWDQTWTQLAAASSPGVPAIGVSPYEGLWYAAATTDGTLSMWKEAYPQPGWKDIYVSVAFPTPATSATVGSDPLIFNLTSKTGGVQAAVAAVNAEGFAVATKLNTQLDPQSHVATKAPKTKKTKVKKSPKTKH
ncbi:MAG: hypothetical protein U0Q15_00025 [Kineosporiaceae bacterium]